MQHGIRFFSGRRLGTPALTMGLVLCLALMSGSVPSAARAQESDDPLQLLAQLGPFEAPSAAFEMHILRQAGLMPSSESTPGLLSRFLHRLTGGGNIGPPTVLAGGDVIVNDPTDDTPENTTQSETTLAVLGNTIVAGYNNSGPGGFSGLSRSTDLGATWTDLGGIGQSGDPVLAVHEASGTFYYAELASFAGIGASPGIGVAISADDGQTFPTLVNAAPVASTLTGSQDKPWIAVDNTGGPRDGDIYVCWTRFFLGTSELRFSRSIDGGATYQNEQVVAPGGAPFGCSIEVGPNGDVYVSWAQRSTDDILFRRSTDGGIMFGPTVTVNSLPTRAPGTDRVVNCLDFFRTTLNGNIRMLHQTWMAVDTTGGPFDGTIYLVWAHDPGGNVDNSDVHFSFSTDGGAMWSPEIQLGGGGGATDQFEPFVEVGGAGAVSVAWYDRRNDAANNLNVDVYKAFSRDGGLNFDPIIRVTDVTFGVPPILPNFDPNVRSCYMGEYIAIAADRLNFYYSWGDNRNILVTPNFPGGRPDPDVFFDTQPAPIVNEADLTISKSDNPDPVIAGEQLFYDLTVTNDGPDLALDVVVTDNLPSGVTYFSDTDNCVEGPVGTLTCDLGDMLSGDMEQFTIEVAVDPDLVFNAGGPTTITNNASVTGIAIDPDLGNNSVSEDTAVVAAADLEIVSFEAVDPPLEILVGELVDLTLRTVITNNGPSAPMDVQLTTTATASPGATVVPPNLVIVEPALGLNELREVEEVFTVSCQEASGHTFEFVNEIEPLDPADSDPDLSNNQAEVMVAIECVLPVAINIKPGSDPNSINMRSSVPVAVLTTAAGEYGLPVAFDATTIDPLSVRFGPADIVFPETGGASERHNRGHIEDAFELDEVTKDGDDDMVLHFRASESGIQPGDTEACVKGEWVDQGGNVHKFFGCDAIRTVPPDHSGKGNSVPQDPAGGGESEEMGLRRQRSLGA